MLDKLGRARRYTLVLVFVSAVVWFVAINTTWPGAIITAAILGLWVALGVTINAIARRQNGTQPKR